MSRRPLTWLLPVLAAALCYQGTLDAGFAFDDPVAVIDNPLVDGRLPAVEALSRSFWGDRPGFEHLASWRPLTVWSLRLDHVLGGGEPGAFHTTNLLLLLALVFAVVRLGLRWGLSPWGAGMVGLVVAVHPMMSEAVASVVGRGDLLAALFGVLGLTAGLFRPRLALGLFVLGLLAKESAVVYLGAGCVLALLARQRAVLLRWAVAGVAWYVLRSLVVGQGGGEVLALDNQVVAMEGVERIVACLAIAGRYIAWWLVPQVTAPDYAVAVSLPDVGHAYAWLGGVGLVALSGALGVAAGRDRRVPAVGIALALGTLLLLSNLVVVLPTPLAGRLAVPVFLGLTLAATADFGRAGPRTRWVGVGLIAAWLAVGVPTTLAQVAAWQGDGPLFAQAVEIEPESVKARCNHARQLSRAGDLKEARLHLEEALKLAPEHPLALTNMAVVLERLGEGEAAWSMALRAAEVEPRPGVAQANLCALAVTRAPRMNDPGWDERALKACTAGVSAIPNEVEPWVNLARAQARSGQLEAADATYERAERRFGTPAFLLGHRVGFLLGVGRFEEALSAQRTLMAQRSDDEASRRNMVAVLAAVGDARLKDGDGVGACAIAEEMKALAPGVSMVAQRAARMCPR